MDEEATKATFAKLIRAFKGVTNVPWGYQF